MIRRIRIGMVAVGALLLGITCQAHANEKINLQVLSTNDLHMYLEDYDYYADKPDPAVGLVRVAPLIHAARAANPNSILVDNGDLIQGTPMGDWVARERGVGPDQPTHPAMAAMNLLGYDAASLGNHEFNYGLDVLRDVYAGAKFPVLSGNVFKVDGDTNPDNDPLLYPAFTILDRDLVDTAGKKHKVRIGILGLLPPQIMVWDKDKLEGRVTTRDMIDMARIHVPTMKAQGADIVLVVSHGGFSYNPREGGEENPSNFLTEIAGVDAVLTGHSHRVFPASDYSTLPGADIQKGTINGKPVVMAGYYGSHLGIVDLTLEKQGKVWKVVDGRSVAQPIQTRQDGKPIFTEPDTEIGALLEPSHQGTLAYVRRGVGRTTGRIHSYFAFLGDSAAVELVAKAQRDYVIKALAGTPYAGLPVLSAAAPFKSGGRPGVGYYTDIAVGDVAMRNVADLYIFPNQIAAVRLTGAQVRDWLEMSSQALAVIDPASSAPQNIVNRRVPSYQFDVMDGVTYSIDLTQPLRFDRDGKLVDAKANRIKDLRYQGKPVTDDQLFVVASNSYRANGGGSFPHLNGSNIVHASPDTVQQVIVDYIRAKGIVEPSTDNSFRLAPVPASVNLVYDSSPIAQQLLAEQPALSYIGPANDGFSLFKVDTAKLSGAGK